MIRAGTVNGGDRSLMKAFKGRGLVALSSDSLTLFLNLDKVSARINSKPSRMIQKSVQPRLNV